MLRQIDYTTRIAETDTCILYLTSGTSDTPKGVMRSHLSTLWTEWGSEFLPALAPQQTTALLFNSLGWIASQFVIAPVMKRRGRLVVLDGTLQYFY